MYAEKLFCQIVAAGSHEEKVFLKSLLVSELEGIGSDLPSTVLLHAVQAARIAKQKLVSLAPRGRARWNPERLSTPQSPPQIMVDLERIRRLGDDVGFLEDIQDFYREKIWKFVRNCKRPISAVAIDKSVPSEIDLVKALLKIAAPAKVLLVTRNPIDQVADFLRCEVKSRQDYAKFFVNLDRDLDRRAEVTSTFVSLARGNPEVVKVVTFESLIRDHVRQLKKIADWVGFTPAFSPYKRLDIALSARNIGLSPSDENLSKKVKNHRLTHEYLRARDLHLGTET